MVKKLFCSIMLLVGIAVTSMAANVLEVNTKKTGDVIQSTMWGMFLEDINYGADGGLYGELVKNRSFEFPQSLMGWQTFGKVTLKDDGPFERCPHYVTLSYSGHKELKTGLVNEGFFGMGITEGEEYRFTVWAKAPSGHGRIVIQLMDPDSWGERQEFASVKLDIYSKEWTKHEVIIKAPVSNDDARLRIFLDGKNEVSLEHISLFPVNTFKGRENGLRADIAQAIADGHPGVFRFPGGCIVEGMSLDTRYQWKNTIGPVENRPINANRWESTFSYRHYPDYYQSYGLGFYEYFLFCEDIGAEPLPVLNCGMTCQYQNWNDESAHAAMDELEPYIQDYLDLIEFANGDTTTVYGKIRAEMGHPEPFGLRMMGVGNEQWDTLYFKRLKPFVAALRKAHPEILLIGTSGPDSEGDKFDIGWVAMREQKADIVDEHFYRPETWFLSEGLRYDSYDRKGPKVFAGEYACHGKGKKWNHYEASILEAAFMTGMERNAGVVWLTAYAPLLAHVKGWQWRPDLIWFDNTRVVKSVSYYVQQLFATNRGTNVLPLTMDGAVVAGQEGQNGLFASAVIDKGDGTIIVKVANTSSEAQPVTINLKGLKGDYSASTIVLSSTELDADNTFDDPLHIIPTEGVIDITTVDKVATINDALDAMSFKVYKITK